MGGRVGEGGQALGGPAMHQQRAVRKSVQQRQGFQLRRRSLGGGHVARAVIGEHVGPW